MTCREDKFWVIFVGPMVLPRLDISYNNCSRKLLRFGDYTRAASESASDSLSLEAAVT